MPFIANTPESLVARSDSRNPATTCRGITAAGRPCRRPLAASHCTARQVHGRLRPPFSTQRQLDDLDARQLYCWQHREQASQSSCLSPGPRPTMAPVLEKRTSLDTLAERLEMLGMDSIRSEKHRRNATQERTQRPHLVSAKPKKGLARVSCCFALDDVPSPLPRPRPHPVQTDNIAPSSSHIRQHRRASALNTTVALPPAHDQNFPRNPQSSRRPQTASVSARYVALIPLTTLPQTVSALTAELARPVSQMDEPGYIYMFRLTLEATKTTPPAKAARSSHQCRISDVMPSSGDVPIQARGNPIGGPHNNTLLLKIGRASNVQRRLNEWRRQCGYDISLIRYYPYIPSTPYSTGTPSSGIEPRKILHSHKVERLIHLELAGLGMRVADAGKCVACGREHREWFQVEPTRKAVASVDEIIRRWSDWDEGLLS